MANKNMRFDVVVGNPPYNSPKVFNNNNSRGGSEEGKGLWIRFAIMSIDLVKENGYFCFIHPGAWRKPNHKLLKKIKNKNLIFLEAHSRKDGSKTFKSITSYDWYIIQNKRYDGITTIIDYNKELNVIDIREWDFIPNSDFKLVKSILANKEDDKCEIVFGHRYHTEKEHMSKIKDDKFIFPCVYKYSLKDKLTTLFSSRNDLGHFGVSKVIIPVSDCPNAFVDIDGVYGLTQWAYGIKIYSEEEGNNIVKALKGDKFAKIWKATNWGTSSYHIFSYFKRDFWKDFI